MDALLKHLPSLRVPAQSSRVYKDECTFSFHNAEDEGGLLVDMNSFFAFSPKYALLNHKKTSHAIYLNIVRRRVAKAKEEKANPVSVLGIGVQGGFKADDEFDFEDVFEYSIVLLPTGQRFAYPDRNLPMLVIQSADAIIAADSVAKKEEVKAWVASDDVKESPLARALFQEQNGRKLPSSGWTCDVCGGDATTNLWLNLSSGAVLCGRKNYDGTGGRGHALEHYQKHNYPLAVKLGTITGEGQADVWSYVDDNLVIDPLLDQHLAHWGLNIKELKKTDKTVAELEVELQNTFDWSRATESGKALVRKYGPGFTGLENLGNSCYMASVMQVLFKIDTFVDRYARSAERFFQEPSADPARDFHIQMAKLGHALVSGDYSQPPPENVPEPVVGQTIKKLPPCSVKPAMFKSVIGAAKEQFASNGQQDAAEFLQFLLELIHRREHAKADGQDPSQIFAFRLIERLECSLSRKVRYNTIDTNLLSLPIPEELSQNADEVDEYNAIEMSKSQEQKDHEKATNTAPTPVRHRIALEDCLSKYFAEESIENWYSPAAKINTTALQTKRFGEFPPILALPLSRFTFVPGKGPTKIDADVIAPDELDLSAFLGSWLKPSEEELPTEQAAAPKLDESLIQSIMSMGFTRVRAENAVAKNPGQGADAVIDFLFTNADSPELDVPLPKSGGQADDDSNSNEEQIAMLMSMGFPQRGLCVKALKSCGNDLERAIEWLFSHGSDAMDVEETKLSKEAPKFKSSSPRYKLFAFITHLGTSTQSGHYIAHIKDESGQFYLFNDSKVSVSQEPPRTMSYIYFYKQV